MTPLAFTTRRRCGCASAASHSRAAAATLPPSPPARIRARSASITARAARTASACGTSESEAASSSTDGSARKRSATSGEGAFDPATCATLDLLLPNRRLGLDPVDRLARAGERLPAVRRRGRHDHRRLRQRHQPDAVLGSDRGQAVRLLRRGEDRRDLLLRHLAIGLVLERLDLASHTFEYD